MLTDRPLRCTTCGCARLHPQTPGSDILVCGVCQTTDEVEYVPDLWRGEYDEPA